MPQTGLPPKHREADGIGHLRFDGPGQRAESEAVGADGLLALTGEGKTLPGKFNVGKNFSEISGQYFNQCFKPGDKKFFQLFFQESSISSCH